MVLLFCRNTLKLRIELPRAYQNRTLRASVPVLTWTRASHLSGASGGRRETFLGDILHGVTLCDSSSNGRIELNPNNADINGDAWVPSGATRWSSLLWSHVLKMKWRTLAEVHVGQGPSHHRIRAEKNTCFFYQNVSWLKPHPADTVDMLHAFTPILSLRGQRPVWQF